MGGFFAAALREDCVFDLFFGTDYHSHLGTRRAGLAVYGKKGFDRAIHNIENSPFRTKFEKEANAMQGTMGIGCISDYDPQPLVVRSHHGTYALTTVGKVNNKDRLLDVIMKNTGIHFFEMASGDINSTELVATLINQKDSLVEGIQYAQEMIDGSMTLLVLSADGIYCARDRFGRTPLTIGLKDEGFCASFEPFAYLNLGYRDYKELGPGEIDLMTPEGVTTLVPPGEKMSICTFLWVYYGYPSSHYEGVSVEQMRYNCGRMLARRDGMSRERIDTVAGVPDSGIAHAIGYANESGVPFSRPLIKYTPTWPRSFIPTIQSKRDMIAKMKLIPVRELIERQRLLLIDDSIVRGTQLRETVEFLYSAGASEVHMRSACPPIMYPCRYLNFSRGNSPMDLLARRMVQQLEGNEGQKHLEEYADSSCERGKCLLHAICEQFGFDSLSYQSLEGMLEAIGIDREQVCTYCWTGKE